MEVRVGVAGLLLRRWPALFTQANLPSFILNKVPLLALAG